MALPQAQGRLGGRDLPVHLQRVRPVALIRRLATPIGVLAVLAALAAGACDSDTAAPDVTPWDAGPDGAPPRGEEPAPDCPSGRADRGVCLPVEPAPPEPPRLADWDCPEGWIPTPSFRDAEGAPSAPPGLTQHHHCRPPEPPRDCPPGTMPVLGSGECVPHGEPCPEGPWPTDEVVRRLAAGSGRSYDGRIHRIDASREGPMPSMRPGDIAALSKGTHEIGLAVRLDVAFVGACVEQTRLRSPAGAAAVPLLMQAGGVVANLSVADGSHGIAIASPDRPVTLEAVRFEGALGIAVRAEGTAALHLRDTWIAGVTPELGAGGQGIGLLDSGATAERVTIEHATGFAAIVKGAGASLTATDLLVRQTRRGEVAGAAGGVGVLAGALTLNRALLVDGSIAGVATVPVPDAPAGHRPAVSLTDVLSADTAAPPGQGYGVAVLLLAPATVTATRVASIDNQGGGFVAQVPDAHLDLTDVLVTGRSWRATDTPVALLVAAGATAEAERVVVSAFDGVPLGATGPSAETDLAACDVVLDGVEVWGPSLAAADGATLRTTRLSLTRSGVHAAAAAHGRASRLVLTDLRLVAPGSPKPEAPGDATLAASGMGLLVQAGARLDATRVALDDVRTIGAHAVGAGTRLEIVDGRISGVSHHSQAAPDGARGLEVAGGAVVVGSRLAIERVQGFGLVLAGGTGGEPAPQSLIDDLRVDDTAAATCHEADCTGGNGGSALMAVLSGRAALSGFLVRRSALAGFVFSRGGTMTATDGGLMDNAVAISIQDAGSDPTAAFERVALVGNEVDVDRSEPRPVRLLDVAPIAGLLAGAAGP